MIREGLRNNSSTLTQFTQGYCHTWGPHKYSFPFQSQNCIFLETQESQNQMLQPKLIECKTMYYNSKTAFPYEMEKIHILPRKIVFKEHNLGPLGTESAFSGSTIFQEHNLDSLGMQYWLSYHTIYILRDHNFGSPGTKSQFSEETIFPFLIYNPCSLGTQSEHNHCFYEAFSTIFCFGRTEILFSKNHFPCAVFFDAPHSLDNA